MMLGTFLAAGAARLAWPLLRPERGAPRPDHEAISKLLKERSASTPAPSNAPARTGRALRPEDRRWYLSREEARKIFPINARGQRYDPWCFYSHIPNLDHEVEWPEHPRGKWIYRTNSIGLREDAEVLPELPDLRVLVTGDSQSEGFCDNADAWPNLVEAALARRFPEIGVEVLNAADGGYSFHQYLCVLEKFLDLRPHLFVVAVFGGNDFEEFLVPYRYFARLPPVGAPEDVQVRMQTVGDGRLPLLIQGLYSAAYFRSRPEEVQVASRESLALMAEMKRVCDEHAIRMLCLYLPSPIEFEAGSRQADLDLAIAALDLRPADLEAHAEMGRSFVREVGQLGIETLDAGDALRAEPGPCFWYGDQHLNLAGNRAVAAALEPLVVRLAGLGER
ncbi:MAG TPA: hypothetical protein VMS76_11845 [Planctomycetota bacterium]|nr:hypothetical protein [Planctomycetota bacterium]